MTRQKSEDCVVPEGWRKPVPTRGAERRGGGKVVPVKEVDRHLMTTLATAENSGQDPGAEDVDGMDRFMAATRKVPKAKAEHGGTGPATTEEVDEDGSAVVRGSRDAIRQTGARLSDGALPNSSSRCRPGTASAVLGYREVVNRPAAGVITRRPEEPYVNSTSTVPW
jgi:hypothetical protein